MRLKKRDVALRIIVALVLLFLAVGCGDEGPPEVPEVFDPQALVKISALTELTVPAADDDLPIVDDSADTTKRIEIQNLFSNLDLDLGTGNLTVAGTSDLGGNVSSSVGGITIADTLNATGAVDFDSILNVDGAATLNSTLDVDGAITSGTGAVTVTDSVVFSNTADSTTAYQMYDADGGTPIFNIDSTNERLGIGISGPSAKVHVDQADSSGAVPVITVDQADVSEEFFRFIGTAQNGVLTQSVISATDVTTATLMGYLEIYVQDDGNQVVDSSYFVPFYSLQ